jgi:heat shock protein HslJ
MKTSHENFILTKLFILILISFMSLNAFNYQSLKAGSLCKTNESDSLLGSTWILRTLNGNDVLREKAGYGIPYLSININDYSVLGSTGCNTISGKASVTDDEIKFSEMSMTKMFCSDAEYEQDFVSPLFQDGVVKYKLDNGKLIFYKKDIAIMSFEKKQ